MTEHDLNLFEAEKLLLEEAKALVEGGAYNEQLLMGKFKIVLNQFDKLIRDAEKIIKISDGQQEYLHKVKHDLEKEIQERIRAEEKLKYLAAVDTLTGSYNRGVGLTCIEEEIKKIKKSKSFFSLCYIDVNGLKYVNDNFGHFKGDELLISVCRHIKEGIRGKDTLCRLGGDEFIVLTPGISYQEAGEMIKRIVLSIEAENEKKVRLYPISFSFGIVQVDYNSEYSIDEIIQMADEKMYRCKKKFKKQC